MATIPGYRYSFGPILADMNQRTIPGFRYSVGPILAEEEDDFFTLQAKQSPPPRPPTRRLTKRTRPVRMPLRAHASSHSRADSGVDVSSLKTSKHATMSSVSSGASMHTAVTSMSSGSSRHTAMSSISSTSSGHATMSSVSSASSNHAAKSSISSVDSCRLSPLLESTAFNKTPTLTPMSDERILDPEKLAIPSPIEDRFVFPKTKRGTARWMGQFIDHFRQKAEAKQQKKDAKKQNEIEESQTKSHYLFTEARERRSMEKIGNKIPIWLTTEEKRVIEGHRRQVLELRLEKALRGRRYRIAHQIDGELKILGGDEFSSENVEGQML